MNDQDMFTSQDLFGTRDDRDVSPGILYTSVGIAVAVTASVMGLLACCVIRRKSKPDQTVVKEGYSVAVDAVSVHQYERYHYAEYAIPEDALKNVKAQHRVSIVDGEYDTLTRNFKRARANTGHVYSHVTISENSSIRQNVSNSESPYDVTPYSKTAGAIVTVSPLDKKGDTYGHVTINPMERVMSE